MRPISKIGDTVLMGKELKVVLTSNMGKVLGASLEITPVSSEENSQVLPMSEPPILPSCEKPLVGYFFIGSDNNRPKELRKLQTFLRDREGFTDVIESGIYDMQTISAVKEFQTRYQEDILRPWNITDPTGNVYKTTRKKINEIICPGGNFTLELKESVLSRETEEPVSTTTAVVSSVETVPNTPSNGTISLEEESFSNTLANISARASVYENIVGPLFATHRAWSLMSSVTIFAFLILGLIAVLVLRRN